jgi:uncharacterized protein YcgI (DUF1989 family)
MAEKPYDAIADAKQRATGQFKEAGEKARVASDNGKLKLVREEILQPWDGYGFELDKGQVLRYELIEGPQVIDTVYHVRSRPTEEWADAWTSSLYGALILHEGMHFMSNTPYCRPLLTLIKDTVDYEKLKKTYGETTGHGFIYPSGRCTESLWELTYGEVNACSCNSNLYKAIEQFAGEEVARRIQIPTAFMFFQPTAYDKVPTNMTHYPSGAVLKAGDYVELLAHQDLYVGVSLCPVGDQENYHAYRDFTCWPIKYQILEGADGPLETAPDPELKSMEAVDFVMAGRPDMVVGKTGKKE